MWSERGITQIFGQFKREDGIIFNRLILRHCLSRHLSYAVFLAFHPRRVVGNVFYDQKIIGHTRPYIYVLCVMYIDICIIMCIHYISPPDRSTLIKYELCLCVCLMCVHTLSFYFLLYETLLCYTSFRVLLFISKCRLRVLEFL